MPASPSNVPGRLGLDPGLGHPASPISGALLDHATGEPRAQSFCSLEVTRQGRNSGYRA